MYCVLSLFSGRERKSLAIDPETRRLSSYHEAGHALVGLYTPGAQTIRLATLVPRSHALGMVPAACL
jgi:ATP-dependent Zn protease